MSKANVAPTSLPLYPPKARVMRLPAAYECCVINAQAPPLNTAPGHAHQVKESTRAWSVPIADRDDMCRAQGVSPGKEATT